MKKKTNEEYLAELKQKNRVHKPLEPYNGALTAIFHECPKGHRWPARPHHILQGVGCPTCANNNKHIKYNSLTHEEYEDRLLQLESELYPLEKYTSYSVKLKHECINGHVVEVFPGNVLKGRGCPACAEFGFNYDKPALFYYIKIGDYYKAGITQRSIKNRFMLDSEKPIKILLERSFTTGRLARDYENSIFEEYKNYRVTVDNYLKSGGNTELFLIDILGLDL